MNAKKIAAALALSALATAQANAAIVITEWMYNPGTTGGEFIEFTNTGTTAVNLTGWSFDDNSRAPGSYSLSGFGVVNAGESVILTESSAAAFRTEWNLGANVKVLGGNDQNLSRSDEVNIFNNNSPTPGLVDRLTYNDQGTGTVKGPRTQGVSGRALSATALGANNASLWVLSATGDIEGSWVSLTGDIGSPGKTSYAPSAVPVPAAAWLMLSGIGMLGAKVRRKSRA